MVLIEYVYIRSAAIYCIKNDSGLKSIFTFYNLLVVRGHLWYTEEEDPEDFCPARAKDCVCSPACLPTEKIVKFCA